MDQKGDCWLRVLRFFFIRLMLTLRCRGLRPPAARRVFLQTDDFFPYADNFDAYWTGYFTRFVAMVLLPVVRRPVSACPPPFSQLCSAAAPP